MAKTAGEFRAGDRVELIKPFRYKDDGPVLDQEIDDKLRVTLPAGVNPTGTVTSVSHDAVRVLWDAVDESNVQAYRYVSDPDTIAHEVIISDEDVAEAIRSIIGR